MYKLALFCLLGALSGLAYAEDVTQSDVVSSSDCKVTKDDLCRRQVPAGHCYKCDLNTAISKICTTIFDNIRCTEG